MDLTQLKVFNMLTTRMNWLNERQRVLAQNIANADTPDYVARDLAPPDFKAALRRTEARLGMATTSGAHMAGGGGSAPTTAKTEKREFETTPTGNGVVLEEELMKVAESRGEYELMVNLYTKQVGMLKAAISGGGGRR